MPIEHRVRQGETVTSIAARHGLTPARVWDDPANASLKKQRGDANILFPGDVVVVPEKETKEEGGAVEQRHRFRTHRGTTSLRLVLHDEVDAPIADQPCTLVVGERSFKLTTDGDGLIAQVIPVGEETGSLLLGEQVLPLRIGHLDPLTEVSGQRARLNNLGYHAGEADGAEDPDFLSAVEEFQCDHRLTVDGKCGPKTQAKLKDIHGC